MDFKALTKASSLERRSFLGKPALSNLHLAVFLLVANVMSVSSDTQTSRWLTAPSRNSVQGVADIHSDLRVSDPSYNLNQENRLVR